MKKKSVKSMFLKCAFSMLLLLEGFGVFAQNSASSINVGVLNGPSGIPSAYLMENTTSLNGKDLSYEVYSGANLLLPKLIRGEVDLGFLPPNVAAKAYTASNKCIKVVAVTGHGMLSLITKDSSIRSITDLKGKTVAVAGQGATPEYVFTFLLNQYGLSGGISGCDVTYDFSIPNADIAAALISGKIDYALVPEPFATVACTKDSSVIRALDIQKEAGAFEALGSQYPMTVMVVNADFAQSNPELIKAFLAEYKIASDWTIENPVLAANLSEKHSLGLAAAMVQKAVPNCNFTCVAASSPEAVSSLESLLKLFLESNPASIGGKLPDSGFYYN